MKVLLAVGVCMFILAVSADDLRMPNFQRTAKVGDWVMVKLEGNVEMKQTVTGVTDKHIVIMTEMIMDGTVINTSTSESSLDDTYDPEKYDSPHGKPKVYKGKVKLKGEDVDCWIFEQPVADGNVLKAYFSEKVPVNGMVRSELGDTVTLEVIDYGRE
ncbi:MAG: hypothetical protein JW808_05005 [Victivallales bacterium]|nr:hypothetical protein [Victivallales bacterium]